MAGVTLGHKVPDFSLPVTGGGTWRLREAAGRPLIIYFYPRDMTPGCTLEAQDFRDLYPALRRAGVGLVGISRDTLAKHEKFREREALPFPLLADPDERVCRLFDVMREKNMYGRKVRGIERSTFLLDAAGTLHAQWRKVKVEGHAQEVLEAARSL